MPESPSIQHLKVGLVDDHPLTRFALRSVIVGHPSWQVAFEADSPAELLRQLQREVPEVLLVDLKFGEGCGLELLKTLKAD